MSATVELHVRPLDMSEPGSYKARSTLQRAVFAMQDAQAKDDTLGVLRAKLDLDELVVSRCYMADGSSVEEALAEISADDFDGLLAALLGGGAPSVPPEKSGSSTPGRTAKAARRGGRT
jgi:hypothetical protein